MFATRQLTDQRRFSRLSPRPGTGALAWMVTMAFAGLVAAEPVFPIASQNPDEDNSFTLDFADLGFQTVAHITTTDLILELDADSKTARALDYYQEIDPLTLPGGFSTGNLTVVIQESLGGTYDPDTGVFTTNDLYGIYFDGDLSAFGIESPFVLPGSATGTATYDSDTSGTIDIDWQGQGALPHPADPKMLLPFFYTCRLRTLFLIAGPGDFDADVDVDLEDFAFLQQCFRGPGGGLPEPRCALADFDFSGHVDLNDFATFRDHHTGPN